MKEINNFIWNLLMELKQVVYAFNPSLSKSMSLCVEEEFWGEKKALEC